MKFSKILKDIEYTNKEMLGYFIITYRRVKENLKSTNNNLDDYIRYLIENIERKSILDNIDSKEIEKFLFHHSINNEELLSYAIVVFYILINSNKNFNEKDIIIQLEIEMKLYSARTILDEANKILENYKY